MFLLKKTNKKPHSVFFLLCTRANMSSTFLKPHVSLLLSSAILSANSTTTSRVPLPSTIARRAKAALLHVLATVAGERAVLYGSAALNLYLPRRHWFPESDLDFFIVVDEPDEFGKLVETACTSLNKHLRVVFNDASLTVNWYLLSHGPDDITMSVSVNGNKIADLTRQFSHKACRLTAFFPRKQAMALVSTDSPAFSFWTISLFEALHRMATTVSCTPCLDGSPTLSYQANSSRIAKDNERLLKLAELQSLGVLSDIPSVVTFDTIAPQQGCDTETGCVPVVQTDGDVVLPVFSTLYIKRRPVVTLDLCVSQNSVAPDVIRPAVDAQRLQSCMTRVSELRAVVNSLRLSLQTQQAEFSTFCQTALADMKYVVNRRERKLVAKLEKADSRERACNARITALTKCVRDQKTALRLCRETCKDGLEALVQTANTAAFAKECLIAIRNEARVLVTKFTSILKVIADKSPDDFDVQSLAKSYDKILHLYISKGVPGFVDRSASPTFAISAAVDAGSSKDTDTFICLHSQMVRAMLQANEILLGKFDTRLTYTHARKNAEGVQFFVCGDLDEVSSEDQDLGFRRAEMLNKHAESALVLMIMPPFERLAYISRLARAANADLMENSAIFGLFKKTMPGKIDWSCLDAAASVAERLQRVCTSLVEHA